MKNIFSLFILFLFITGCAIKPTQQELESADYGNYPENYEGIIKSHMNTVLKDPYSAQYRFLNSPRKAWNGWGGTKFGYVVCVNINAKNGFGGYTGEKLYYFLLKNNVVILDFGGDSDFSKAGAEGSCNEILSTYTSEKVVEPTVKEKNTGSSTNPTYRSDAMKDFFDKDFESIKNK